MTGLLRSLRAWHRRDGEATGAQGDAGYVLIMVLAAIGVFSVLVVAILGMVLTDLRVARVVRDGPAFARAIDGALDTAVNQIKTSPGGNVGHIGRSCAAAGTPSPLTVTMEDTTVELTCTPLPSVAASPPVPSTNGSALTLLSGYTGPVDVAASATAALGGTVFTAVSGAAQTWSTQLAAEAPGWFHTGPQPVRVLGDVNVRQWAFGYRHDGAGNPGVSPAFDVTGAYRQGSHGPLGGWGFWIFDSWVATTPPCGLLDPAFPLVPDYGLRLHASRGMACGNPAAAGLTDPQWARPAEWNGPQATPAATAAVTTTCAPLNGVVVITPGRYDRFATATLNSWFAPGTCDGVTFWFRPGDYYFDAAGGPDPSSQGALTFDDPSSNWVFGQPKGWDPATGRATGAAFPAACDITADGVSVTLSGRTTIQHRRGLAALCPRRNADGSPRVLVYQEALGAQVRWGAVPHAATSGQPGFVDPGNATASVAPVPPEFPGYGGPYNTTEGAGDGQRRYATATCNADAVACEPALDLSGFTNAETPAYQGAISDVRLWIRGQPSANVSAPGDLLCAPNCSATGVLIDYAGGGSCLLYQWDVPRGLYSFDLNGCRSQGLVDATQLDGATVKVVPLLRKRTWAETCGWIVYPWWFIPCTPMAFSLDYAWLDVTINAPSAPSQFGSYVDARATEAGLTGSSITFFGPVYAPRSDLVVAWEGGATDMPVFGGGLVAKSLVSLATGPASSVGVLAAPAVRPGQRRVLVLAKVGEQLRGSAVVTVTDSSTGGFFEPGRLLQVEDWRLCNLPWDDARTTPCPS